MKVKRGKSVIRLILKIPQLIVISMVSSQRDLFIDTIVFRFMFNNQITLSRRFTFRTHNRCWTKQGLCFTVVARSTCAKLRNLST